VTSLQGKRAITAGVVAVCAVVITGCATLSYLLGDSPVRAPKVKQEEPASPAGFSLPGKAHPGCWELTVTDSELAARWVAGCDAPGTLGDLPWPSGVVRLPTDGDAAPPMALAQAQATLSAELAQSGLGALLYLPANAAGGGYYVAAWSSDDEAEDSEDAPVPRGLRIGRYGAPPSSIVTPAGRVYLSPELSPKRVVAAPEIHQPDQDSAEPPATLETDDQAEAPPTTTEAALVPLLAPAGDTAPNVEPAA